MAGVAGKGPRAIALAPLATSPRRGDKPGAGPLVSTPPWHNGAGEKAAAGFVLLRFCLFFFF